MIRIIGGEFKGKRIKRVPSRGVRPMQDKLRGALFNILRDRTPGAVVLDGFSGTGSIGLEALSRGAATAVFVDEFYPSIKAIKENIATCGAEDRSVVVFRDYNRAVIDLTRKGVKFDLVILDPPYLLLKDRNPLKVLRKREAMKPGGLIVLRHFDKIIPSTDDFPVVRRVVMGDDVLIFFSTDGPAEGTSEDGSAGTGGMPVGTAAAEGAGGLKKPAASAKIRPKKKMEKSGEEAGR